MSAFGWQRALIWTTLPAFLLIAVLEPGTRATPRREHPGVGAAELAELARARPAANAAHHLAAPLGGAQEPGRAALTFSYVCMNYAFYLLANWSFLYLVQERHFALLEGGCLATTPPIGAAARRRPRRPARPRCSSGVGLRRGLRLVPLVSLPASALLLFLAVDAANAYLAVAALALCFACVEMNEGPVLGGGHARGRADTMAATGVLNTGGNHRRHHRHADHRLPFGTPGLGLCLCIGAVSALVGAALWLLVDPERKADG